MLKISKSYMICIDVTVDDNSVLTVTQHNIDTNKLEVVNILINSTAEHIVTALVGDDSWKEICHENI